MATGGTLSSGWAAETVLRWSQFPESKFNLDLSGYKLAALPEDVLNMRRIKKLNISNNILSSLPEEIGKLATTGVLTINISENKLKTVPETFGTLHDLRQLFLSHNEITTVPKCIGQLTTLIELDLSFNNINHIPDISSLSMISTINLANNKLSSIPKALYELVSLQELDVSHNMITKLDGSKLSGWRLLSTLHLHHNRISELPLSLVLMTHIGTLTLENNPFSSQAIVKQKSLYTRNSYFNYFRNQLRSDPTTRRWLFSEPVTEKNLLFNNQDPPSLIAASPEKFAAYLTGAGFQDLDLVNVIKICNSYFMNLDEYISLFVSYFEYDWNEAHKRSLGIFILLLKTYNDNRSEISSKSLSLLKNFFRLLDERARDQINSVLSKNPNVPDSFFGEKAITGNRTLSFSQENETSNTRVKKWKKSKREKFKRHHSGAHENHILSHTSREIAEQICFMDHERFASIPLKELLHQTWAKNPDQAPKIKKATEHFNDITLWFVTWIITQFDMRMRIRTMQHILDIANDLIEFGDFAGAWMVASALANSNVHRLNKTKAGLDEKHKAIMAQLDQMTDNSRNFANYKQMRDTHITKSNHCIPPLSSYLQQLTFAEDGNDNFYMETDMINFEKFATVTKIIIEIQKFQAFPCPCEFNPVIMAYINAGLRISDKNEQYNASLTCEASIRQLAVAETSSHELSDRDWRLLLTGAKELTFHSETVIIEQNQLNTCLYKLKAGSFKVSKNLHGVQTTLVQTTTVGSVVGEMSVVGSHCRATATISAMPGTICDRVPVAFIFQLFETEPDLARRFYMSVGRKLANLLQKVASVKQLDELRNSGNQELLSASPRGPNTTASSISTSGGETTPPPPATTTTPSTTCVPVHNDNNIAAIEKEFQHKFNLYELLIKHFPASLEKVIMRRGTFYLTQNYVCFYSKIFKQTIKEKVPIAGLSIKVNETAKGKEVNISNNKKKLKLLLSNEDADVVASLLQDILKMQSPDTYVKEEAPTSEKSESGRDILSSEDWELILKGRVAEDPSWTPLKHYKANDVILLEGKQYSTVSQISSGRCRVEKTQLDGSQVLLGTLGAGKVIGELQFLTEQPASATVIAGTDVDMYVIDGDYVKNDLFKSNPQTVVRFYRYLCANMAVLIEQREREGWGR